MPLRVNTERTTEDNVKRVKDAVQLVIAAFPEDESLIRDVRKLEEYGIAMANYAPEYDFRNIQSNGFRSLLEMGIRLMKFSVDIISVRGQRQHYPDFKNIVHSYVSVIPYIQQMREASRESKSVAIYGEMLVDFYVDYLHSPDERAYTTTLIGCYDFGYKVARWVMRYYAMIALSSTNSFIEWIRCVFSGNERKRVLSRILSSSFDIHKLRKFTGQGKTFAQKTFIPWRVNGRACRTRREFLIERQDDLQLHADLVASTVTVIRRKGIPTKSVRCRLLHEPVSGVRPTTLMINVHGGGYCVGSLYNNEVYLRNWAAKVPGKLAFLSIDISLAPEHQFPAQIQEIVDVFLFLTKSPDEKVISTIGFKPEKIILSGDSSGACLVVAATVALNEMRKRWPDDIPVMPDAIFGFYGSFSLDMMMLPSYMICATTFFLSCMVFAVFVESYVPATDVNQNIQMEKEKADGGQGALIGAGRSFVNTFKWIFSIGKREDTDSEINVDMNEKQKTKQDIIDRSKLIKSSYISPINYDDFESLSGVSLFLYVGLTDPVLDHSIALAHKWKGPIELESCNCMHGYLNMIGMDENARASSDRIAERIRRFIDE